MLPERGRVIPPKPPQPFTLRKRLSGRRNAVTVCIAAACKENKEPRIVLCADKKIGTWMAGAEVGFKFSWATRNWPALVAGELRRATEVLATYEDYLSSVNLDRKNVFDEIKKPVLLQKEKLADEYVRGKFGFSYEHLRKHGKKELPASLLYETFSAIKDLELGCQLLIIGFLDHGGNKNEPLIFVVERDFSVAHYPLFAAIGTGGVVAESALYQRKQSNYNELSETFYNVYEAKSLSEISEGVGPSTDMAVLYPATKPTKEEPKPRIRSRFVNADGYQELAKMYKQCSLKAVTTTKWDSSKHLGGF
jgi:hypothetical protein